MKLGCVVTSCNLVPLYCDFIPYFISSWKKLYPSVDIIIVLIGEKIPEKFENYSTYIRLFKPIKGMSTAFMSQYIRLLYPSILNYSDAVVITDIDIIPTNRQYFIDPIKNVNSNSFVYYDTLDMTNRKMYIMCYCLANSSTWSEITNISNCEDIETRLQEVYNSINYVDGHGNNGWNTDQKHLYAYVDKWKNKKERFLQISSKETKYQRLDRRPFINLYSKFNKNDPAQINDTLLLALSKGEFTDYHCYRPYKQYKLLNDKILDIL